MYNMKWKLLIVLFFLTINLSAQHTLIDQKWELVSFKGKPVVDFGKMGKTPFIQFTAKDMCVNGTGGCNNFMGSYSLKGNHEISFSKMASTLMACINMSLEADLLASFEKVMTYSIENNQLILFDAGKSALVVYQLPATQDNSKNSLDWAGDYKGTLPCADCTGIETWVRLLKNNTYEVRSKYSGKSDSTYISKGSFYWTKDGGSVILKNLHGSSTMYLVGENKLIMLDQAGNRISGMQSEKYILQKSQQKITHKK